VQAGEQAAVSGARPDVVNRLDAVKAAIQSLNTLLADEESLDQALQRVAGNAVAAVAGADAVSITVLRDAQWRTAASTDGDLLALDAEQYTSQRGPCLEAARTRRPVRVAIAAEDQRWPEFMSASRDSGVHATLSIPLIIAAESPQDADELVGSVNAYSRRTASFDLVDEKLLSLYTDAASQAIASSRRRARLRETVAQLERALVSRTDIDQAKGALRALNGGSAEDAFASLVERSQRENIKLRDVALQIINELSRSVPPA